MSHYSYVIYRGIWSYGADYIGETVQNAQSRWDKHKNDIDKNSECAILLLYPFFIYMLHLIWCYWDALIVKWSALIIKWPGMLKLLSSIGMENKETFLITYMISISLTLMYPSMRDNLVNSWPVRLFKFQYQNLRAKLLRDPGSLDFNKFFFWCTNNVRQLILVRI